MVVHQSSFNLGTLHYLGMSTRLLGPQEISPAGSAVMLHVRVHQGHDPRIFEAVRDNDVDAVLKLVDADNSCLLARDTEGRAPIHIAFLFGHYELGKQLVLRRRDLATLAYISNDPSAAPSPCEGENILHLAILARERNVVRWLLDHAPELVEARVVGDFFAPWTGRYFGDSPLLFALATDQVPMARQILEATRQREDKALNTGEPLAFLHDKMTPDVEEEPIFASDKYDNNVLHLAVIHDLPEVYDFAVQHAITLLRSSAGNAINKAEITSENQGDSRDGGASSMPQLVHFFKEADPSAHDCMRRFLAHRNADGLTPLSLAATIGNQRMFQRILRQSSHMSWRCGPTTAWSVPLLDLDLPERRPVPSSSGLLHFVRQTVAHMPMTPNNTTAFPTAIECLCSVAQISSTLSGPRKKLQQAKKNRLEMLKLPEVQQLLHTKWEYVGKGRFFRRFLIYALVMALLTVNMLFEYSKASRIAGGLLITADVIAVGLVTLKLWHELSRAVLDFRSYRIQTNAKWLDTVCTVIVGVSLDLSMIERVLVRNEEAGDALEGVTLVFAWFYLLFFMLGFRTAGPSVIMILRMLHRDITRFAIVYSAVLVGFSQAIYLVHDGRRGGMDALVFRMRTLFIAGFTGEINYDDTYADPGGRMNFFTQILVFFYVLLVVILLVSLLIAMMGNTYAEVLEDSEQRWVAERANVMTALELNFSARTNLDMRKEYALELPNGRAGETELFFHVEIDDGGKWLVDQERLPVFDSSFRPFNIVQEA